MSVDDIGEMPSVADEQELGRVALQLGIQSAEELADMARFYHAGQYRLRLVEAAARQIQLALRGL